MSSLEGISVPASVLTFLYSSSNDPNMGVSPFTAYLQEEEETS